MKKFAIILVSLLVVACQGAPKKDVSTTIGAQPQHGGPSHLGDGANNGGGNGNAPGPNQSIYFEYAKSAIAPDYSSVIQNEARNAKGAVTVEGNCDERGSDEYNLGLGQRRADAVKKLLVAAGVPATQIRTTSYGKEKPKATCHDESCWKENRRVDFVRGS